MSLPPRRPPKAPVLRWLTLADRIEMMALYDALPRELRVFIAFGPDYESPDGMRAIANAMRSRGVTVEWVKSTLRLGWRGMAATEARIWERAGHLMPYPHIGANATIMWTQPFDKPKNARERLAARRRVARLRMPAPNPIREPKRAPVPDVICL